MRLPIEVNFEFKINCGKCEMIPLFSKNKANYGSGIEDGLSLYASSLEKDFTFRTKIFGPSPNITFSDTFKLEEGKWYNFSGIID